MTPSNFAHKYVDIGLFQPKRLAFGQVPSAAAQAFPATSGNTLANQAILQKVLVANTSGVAATFSLRITAGTAATNAKDIISAFSVPASSYLYLDFGKEGIVLEAGDALWWVSGTNNVLNAVLSGGTTYTA